jgi:hypothetical protein
MKNILTLFCGIFLLGHSCFAQLTRTQIINNGLPYTTFSWTAYSGNVLANGHSCSITGETVYAPTCWVIVGSNISMPYCWGGWTTMAQHIGQMTANSGTQAGDVCSATGSSCSNGGGCSGLQSSPLSCGSGNDCSGFVSICWGLNQKYSTSTLPGISTQIAITQTQPGDIVDIPGDHTRLIETNYGNGNYQVMESSADGWNCAIHTYTANDLSSYTPYCWNNVTGGCSITPTCSPTTTNDYCYGPPAPAVLTPGTTATYINGTTCGATQSMAPATCSGNTAATALDVWYSFRANNASATVMVQSGTNFDAVLQVLSSACGTSMQCVNSTGTGGLETISLTGLNVDSVYYIRVYDYNGNSNGTDFQICVISNTCTGWGVSPTSNNVAVAGGSGSFTVSSGCSFTAQSSVAWVNNVSISGNTVSYNVSANTSCSAQTGYIYVYDAASVLQATFTINQTGLSAPTQPASISGNTSLCNGNQQTYSIPTVNSATSYTWTLPNGWNGNSTTNSISTTAGSGSGNISVTANNACGSSTAQTIAVTVNSAPSQPGNITGNTTVCTGSDTYTITPVTGATSYTWTLPGGWSGTSTTNTITATTGSSGNITVAANNLCGSSGAQTLSVTVSGTPTISISPSNPELCTGNSVLLTASPTGSAYAWSGPNNFTGNAVSVSASSIGSYTVTVTNAGGCSGTFSGSVSIAQGTSPTVSAGNNQAVASGTNTTLGGSPTATGGAGGYNYTWSSSPAGFTSSSANPAVAPTVTTTYLVTVTDANGCSGTGSVTITIQGGGCDTTIHPIVSVNLCDLAVAQYNSAHYQWQLNGSDIPQATSRFYNVNSSAYYTCFVTIANCSYYSNDAFVSYSQQTCATAINELSAINNLSIVPNPSNGSFMVSFEVNQGIEMQIKIYDLLGQLVQTEQPAKISGLYSKQVNLGNVSKGVYILQIQTADGILDRKVEVN